MIFINIINFHRIPIILDFCCWVDPQKVMFIEVQFLTTHCFNMIIYCSQLDKSLNLWFLYLYPQKLIPRNIHETTVTVIFFYTVQLYIVTAGLISTSSTQAINYEALGASGRSYVITVTVTDSFDTATQSLSVAITDQNEAPVFGKASYAISGNEGNVMKQNTATLYINKSTILKWLFLMFPRC